MNKNNSPPRRNVRLEREKNNRAVAQLGWAPTLRLALLRVPVAAVILYVTRDQWGPRVLQVLQTFI